ncbi:hypothetical protein [Thermoflexus sp.]|uniref:hypothetical protein n=1 Tax=Thermoflexus sp. TaxID=1969742 RepID=UPI002ADE09B3|nr:hypothetical protein [Thermoflexus sp.]
MDDRFRFDRFQTILPGWIRRAVITIYVILAIGAMLAGLWVGSELAIPCRGEALEGAPTSILVGEDGKGAPVRVIPDGYLVAAERVVLCGETAHVRARDLSKRMYRYPNRFRSVVVHRTIVDWILYGR